MSEAYPEAHIDKNPDFVRGHWLLYEQFESASDLIAYWSVAKFKRRRNRWAG